MSKENIDLMEVEIEKKIEKEKEAETKAETKTEQVEPKRNFRFLGAYSIIYALFYTFCLYRNASGITYPFFVAGTLFYFFLCMKKLEVSLKKDTWFYMGSVLLLGVSICLTGDVRLQVMSKTGIFILLISFMIHQFYRDEKWGFGKHISSFWDAGIATVASIMHPIGDLFENGKEENSEKKRKRKYICFGILIAIPLVFIILFLLIGADAVFGWVLSETFAFLEKISIPQNIWSTFFLTIFIYFLSYSFLRSLDKRQILEKTEDKRKKEPMIAITFTSIIAAIYIPFCFLQIAGMFFREKILPPGFSYAEYAREGFFQLLFVCGLNLVIVLMCMTYFRESKPLKIILTLISVCTYIMTISSAVRMLFYMKEFYLTFLRIFVLWSLVVIFLLITGVLLSIYKQEFPLFRYSVLVVTALYIGLSFSHPDYFIAKYNMNAMEHAVGKDSYAYYQYGDWDYLYSLSSDATPVLAKEYDKKAENRTKKNMEDKIEETNRTGYFYEKEAEYESMGFREFNLSRYLAGKAAEKILR